MADSNSIRPVGNSYAQNLHFTLWVAFTEVGVSDEAYALDIGDLLFSNRRVSCYGNWFPIPGDPATAASYQ